MPDTDKREEIRRVASQCFAHFGFSKTTMDDIGRQVGLNKASLYYYYKNKEAIFCEIIEAEGEAFLADLKEKIHPLDGWDQKIQAYLLERQRYFQQTTNLHKLSVKTADQLQFQPMFRELADRFAKGEVSLINKILDQALEAGQIRESDTERTARVILSVANSLKNEHMGIRKTDLTMDDAVFKSIEEDTRFAVGLILDGLSCQTLG
ncbi:MAG: TetR/AcrR family transcriptional regulator [Desulfobacterales bacterium]|nr:TetR/AcrR family transcriptional regulator [Desulfobacterales bacterium]